MTNDLLQAAKAALLRSGSPLNIGQIRTAIETDTKVPAPASFRKEIKKALSGDPEVFVWPDYKGSPLYFGRSFRVCLEENLLTVLDEAPLTVAGAGKAVRKVLRCLSEKRAIAETGVVLPQLVASGKIVRVAINRQTAIYLGRGWIAKQAQSGPNKDALASIIPSVVAHLQSVSGTYARVDHLRRAAEICAIEDRAILQLADSGTLVLAKYDGPRPVPDDQKWIYVEDQRGELFIGVAISRASEAQ